MAYSVLSSGGSPLDSRTSSASWPVPREGDRGWGGVPRSRVGLGSRGRATVDGVEVAAGIRKIIHGVAPRGGEERLARFVEDRFCQRLADRSHLGPGIFSGCELL